jgi:hypothetical protein
MSLMQRLDHKGQPEHFLHTQRPTANLYPARAGAVQSDGFRQLGLAGRERIRDMGQNQIMFDAHSLASGMIRFLPSGKEKTENRIRRLTWPGWRLSYYNHTIISI